MRNFVGIMIGCLAGAAVTTVVISAMRAVPDKSGTSPSVASSLPAYEPIGKVVVNETIFEALATAGITQQQVLKARDFEIEAAVSKYFMNQKAVFDQLRLTSIDAGTHNAQLKLGQDFDYATFAIEVQADLAASESEKARYLQNGSQQSVSGIVESVSFWHYDKRRVIKFLIKDASLRTR